MTCHNFIFFTIDSLFYELSSITQKKYKKILLQLLQQEKKVIIEPYTTLGLKTNTTFLLWLQAENVETIQDFLNTLMHTSIGRYLRITHVLFGMVRPTQYAKEAKGHLDTNRKGGKYLIIYPFTKTQEWYFLDFETRRKLMGGHVGIAKKYSKDITQLLLYSYGVDDSEFIVSYETDDLLAFQALVMELRSDKVREYTLKDTPIFLCIYRSLQELSDFL